MKVLFFLLFSLMSLTAFSQSDNKIPDPTEKQWYNTDRKFANCEFKGQSMNLVKVRFTNVANAKYKVRIVDNNEDLTVRYVTNSWRNDLCGQWIVNDTGHPDFTVAVVEYGEDFTIRITKD